MSIRFCSAKPAGRLVWLAVCMLSLLSSCGGGSSAGSGKVQLTTGQSSAVSSGNLQASSLATASVSSTSADSSSVETIALKAQVSYDLVPHNSNHIGLNHTATSRMPVRGAVIELLNESGVVVAADITNAQGEHTFAVPKNTLLRVRVKAQLLQSQSPTWDFKVTDNTNNNAVYVLEGGLQTSGEESSLRELHAASGWNQSQGQYSAVRAAAPFAILDNIYIGATRLRDAGNRQNMPALQLRWSTKNKAAEGNQSLGEIGTSYFDGSAIYILGDANNDSDEYDGHVIVHEWGHYLEQNLFRSDSFGGNHSDGDVLDMRVSMSEGFANALASMMLDDPYYSDSSGYGQGAGFVIDVSRRVRSVKGFYSEGSIGSIFYNYYLSANNKTARDFSPLLQVLSDTSYLTHDAMTSIFLFYARFKELLSSQAVEFNNLMKEQNIFGTTAYGENENNDVFYTADLSLYKNIQANGGALSACSSPRFGKYNKLANSQLLKLSIAQSKSYSIFITRSNDTQVATKPEVIVFSRGDTLKTFKSAGLNLTTGSLSLSPGVYILEVYDANNRDENNMQDNTTCFNVQVSAN